MKAALITDWHPAFNYSHFDGTFMTKVTHAVYSQGVLKPDEDLGLREGQRVRLIVDTIDENPEERSAALARLKAGIASMNFCSQGPLPSREQLHDRHD